jgi:phage-related protein
MSWNIIFYKNQNGKEIVKDNIRNLNEDTKSKIARFLDLLRHEGPFLGMPYSKKISSNIFELRIHGKQETRIFYTFKGNNIHMLHIFQKRTQKTPKNEIETAIIRSKSLTRI